VLFLAVSECVYREQLSVMGHDHPGHRMSNDAFSVVGHWRHSLSMGFKAPQGHCSTPMSAIFMAGLAALVTVARAVVSA
jgi:hypothetical protein